MKRKANLYAVTLYGVTIYSERPRMVGVTELPSDFVAVKNDRVLIAGKPTADAVQWAFSELGFQRAEITRYPAGQGVTGLMVDLVA